MKKAKEKERTVSKGLRNSDDRDFILIAIAYAEEAIADRKRKKFGKWVRLAAKRFMDDLRKSQRKRPPFYWSASWANRACQFIEGLRHVEGNWGGDNRIYLEPAQIFFIVNLFGFRKADGSRRFSTALLLTARKNAKSTLASAILLCCFCLESEAGPQILSAATTGAQARIVWSVAQKMTLADSELREAFSLEAFANTIARYDVGGSFKPINSKASTQDGLNPSALCFDELHAHKSRDLFDVLRSAAGARKNPLFLYTTTEGYENAGPWAEVRNFARQVLMNVVDADHFMAVCYALDDDDDDFDESKWIKANPLLGLSVTVEKLREHATEARHQPGALAEFQIKRLNRQAASGSGWINLHRWRQCGGPVDLDALAGKPCYAALDLAATTDMNALRFVWLVEDVFYTWGRYWVPEAAIAQRNERGTVRYSPWVQAGHIKQTAGDVTDYDVIRADVVELCARFKPLEIAYDPWNATHLVNQLNEDGLPMVQFIQGPKSYNPAMQALERAYTSRTLRHGGDPVLLWNAANIVARRDANMNMAPDKRKSADKIDGMVALLMAIGRASTMNDVNAVNRQPFVVLA